MPNFMNSFKIDDFIDRKDKNVERLLNTCRVDEVSKLKKIIVGNYAKFKAQKKAYDAVINQQKSIEMRKKKYKKTEEELKALEEAVKEKRKKKALEDRKEGIRLKEEKEIEVIQNQGAEKKKAGDFLDNIFGKIDFNSIDEALGVNDNQKEADDDILMGENLNNFMEEIFLDAPNEENMGLQEQEVPQVQAGQEAQPVQAGQEVPQVQEGQEVPQVQAGQEAQPVQDEDDRKITEKKTDLNSIKAEIENDEIRLQSLIETFKQVGGVIDEDGSIEVDNNKIIKEVINLSAEKKKELGDKAVKHLEKIALSDDEEDVMEDLPWYDKFDINFEEDLSDEEEEEIERTVEETSNKLEPKDNDIEQYKNNPEGYKKGAENTNDIDSKLWFSILHMTKREALSEVDTDKLDDKDIEPVDIGLPENCKLSKDENDFTKDNMDKTVESLQINDTASAIAALKKLAQIKTKIDFEIGNESLRTELALEGEDLKDIKANYLVANGKSVPMLMKKAYMQLEKKIRTKAMTAFKAEVNISENMSVDEFTSLMDFDSNEKANYCRNHGCDLTDKIVKVYKKARNPKDEVGLDYAKKIFDMNIKSAFDEVKNALGSDRTKETVERGGKVFEDDTEKLLDEVWKENVGDKILENNSTLEAAHAFRVINKVIDNGVKLEKKGLTGPVDIFNPHVRPAKNVSVDKDELKRSNSFINSGNRPADITELDNEYEQKAEAKIIAKKNNLDNHNRDWEERFKPKTVSLNGKDDWAMLSFSTEMPQIISDLKIYVADASKKRIAHIGAKLAVGKEHEKTLEGINLADASITMRTTQYMMWLIAKKGVDVKDALTQGENEVYKKEFMDFCADYPTGPEEMDENVRTWVRLYEDAYEKIKDYKLPEIDYSSPDRVLEHMDEIILVSALGEYGTELIDKTISYGSGKIVGEVMGRKTLGEMFGLLKGLDTLTKPVRNAYIHPPVIARLMENLDRQVKEMAVDRYIAGKRMEAYAGKKLSEVVAHKHIRNGNQYLDYSDTIFKDKLINADRYPDQKHISREYSVGLLKLGSGMNKKSPMLDEAYAANMAGFSDAAFYMNVAEFKNGLNDIVGDKSVDGSVYGALGSVQRKLVEQTQTAKKMYDFLKSNDLGKPVEKWLENTMAPLIAGGLKETLVKNDIKISDLFSIDNKPVSEYFKEKYKDVKGAVEREKILQLEVLKAIYRGDKKIDIKKFRLDENEHLIDDGFVRAFTDKKSAKKLVDSIGVLEEGLKDIATQLKGYKNELMDALPPVAGETRRAKEERFLTAGSKLYKSMAEALNDAIKTIENPDAKAEDVRKAIQRFQKASKEYSIKREGIFFGPRKPLGKARLRISKEARKGTIDLLMRYDNLRRDVQIDCIIGYQNTKVNDASVNELKNEVELLNTKFRETYAIKKPDFDIAQKVQQNKLLSEKQLKLTNILGTENLSRISLDYKKINLDDMVKDKKGQAPYQYAKNYMCKKYLDAMLKEDNKPQDIDKLINSAKDGKLRKQIFRLLMDDTFNRIINEHPENYYEKMREHETVKNEMKKRAKAEKILTNAASIIDMAEKKGYDKYIKAPVTGADNEQLKDKQYSRLAELVFAQIITSPEYKNVAYNGKFGKKEIKSVKESFKKQLMDDNILGHLNDNELKTKLENGSFKKYAVDILVKGVKKSQAMEKHLGVKTINQIKNEFKNNNQDEVVKRSNSIKNIKGPKL